MVYFDRKYISGNTKGAIAEKLFELMHLELGCQVFRTGQEHLFPHLFSIAKTKKKVWDLVHGGEELEKLKKYYEEEGAPMDCAFMEYFEFKMEKKDHEVALSSFPDFTLISPTAEVRQFEVKYRWNGELEEEQLRKYLGLQYQPIIFIFMSSKPFIKILKHHYCEKIEELPEKTIAVPREVRTPRIGPLSPVGSHVYYKEVEKDAQGSLVMKDELGVKEFVYSPELITKYSQIL